MHIAEVDQVIQGIIVARKTASSPHSPIDSTRRKPALRNDQRNAGTNCCRRARRRREGPRGGYLASSRSVNGFHSAAPSETLNGHLPDYGIEEGD